MIKISMKGVKSTISKLFKISSKVDKKTERLLLAMAYDIDGDAKIELTDRGAVDTGRLRASIHVETPKTSSSVYSDKEGGSFNGKLSVNATKNTLLIGTNVEYAPFIHEGFKSYNGVFFMNRAMERNKAKYKKKFKDILK